MRMRLQRPDDGSLAEQRRVPRRQSTGTVGLLWAGCWLVLLAAGGAGWLLVTSNGNQWIRHLRPPHHCLVPVPVPV